VEHTIGFIKRVFGFSRERYRGSAKNANRRFASCALANRFVARRHLFRARGA
jgi:IS5 family transposase